MLDIESFVLRHFDDMQYYGNPPTDYQVNCPFCSNDVHRHLHISMKKRVAHCFKCGYSSSWVGLIMDVTGLPYHLALGELYQRSSMTEFDLDALFEKEVELVKHRDISLPEDFVPLVECSREGYAYKEYMNKRGFNSKFWRRYNIGMALSVPNRVIIPIEGDYWQGRAIYKWMSPKYMNPKEDSSEYLFNSIALDTYKEIVICEGAFSAMAVGTNAIALIGKECPQIKLGRLINASVDHYIVALEPGAFPTMYKMMDALIAAGKMVTVWDYNYGDPADPRGSFAEFPYDIKHKVSMMLNYPADKFNITRDTFNHEQRTQGKIF